MTLVIRRSTSSVAGVEKQNSALKSVVIGRRAANKRYLVRPPQNCL